MLNGMTVFSIQNTPKDAQIVPFNVLFAYIYDAVVSGKGMFNLQITPSKNKTVALLLTEKFPPLKTTGAGGSVETAFVCVKTVAYIHALVIDCISLQSEDSINTRALQHERAMVHEYSKLKPALFTKHLQSVLTTYYEDIRAMPGASGCPKPKFLTRTLVIDDDATTPEDGAGATQEDGADATQEVGSGAEAGAAVAAEPSEQIEEPAAAKTPPGKRGSKPARPAARKGKAAAGAAASEPDADAD